MNLNGDEKRIQQLFREMSLDDQRRTPDFAGILAAANSGIAHSRNRFPSLRFAMAIAMLCVALLIGLAVIVKPSKPLDPVASDGKVSVPTAPQESAPGSATPDPTLQASVVARHKNVIKRARRRQPSNQIEIAMKSLFAWQSPTASLLQTPDDELLKSLPRLGESWQMIKSLSPEQFN